MAALILPALFLLAAPSAHAAVNLDSWQNEGMRILQAGNYTKAPGADAWSSAVSADASDIISLRVHYHNFTSGETAQNVRARVFYPSNSAASHVASVNLWADNASVYSSSVTINISSSQSLSYIPGSVLFYPKGFASTTLPFSQTGDEINTTAGFNVGDVLYGNEESGFVKLQLRVSGTPSGSGGAPVVTTNNATNVTQNSGTLNGSVNPNGNYATAWFEYGTTPSFGTNTLSNSYGNGSAAVVYTWNLTGLSNNTTYYYRAAANNASSTIYGGTLSFTTSGGSIGCQPITTTNFAGLINKDSATLRGVINPNGRATNGWFEYGTTYALGTATGYQNLGSGSIDTDLINYISGLLSNMSYYFRAVAENNCGKSLGSILNFSTLADTGNPPAVTTLPASSVSQSSAMLNGEANPNGNSATAWFEWGLDANMNSFYATSPFGLGAGNSSIAVSGSPVSLIPNTLYYFRVAAQNGFGISRGAILNFITQPAPAIQPSQPSQPSQPATTANLSIWKETKNLSFPNGTAYVNSASIGDVIEYSLNAKNTGGSILSEVTIKDNLPSQFYFVESNPSLGSGSSGNNLVWNIGLIGSGETKSISLKVKAKPVEQSIVVYNYFSGQSGGVSKTSNKTTTILNPALMALSISVDKENVDRNDTYNYSINYKNIGIADTDKAMIKIILPANTKLIDVSGPDYKSEDGNIFLFNIGEVKKNTSGAINARVRVLDTASAGDKLIATAILDFADIFSSPQPNISVSAATAVGTGFLSAAAALGLSLGGAGFWLYLLLALAAIIIGAVIYIRVKVSKMLKM